jgi:cell division protein FtsW
VAKLFDRPARKTGARKTGARRAVGIAGRPLKISREGEQQARHAVRRRPPLHERLAARVKKETKRWEPPKDVSVSGFVRRLPRNIWDTVLATSPSDVESRKLSGEPIVALVGAVDLVLLLFVTMLVVIGMVMIFSSSINFALDNNHAPSYYLIRQTPGLLLGGVGMYVAMRVDYHRWRYLAGLGIVVSIVLLILAHFPRFGGHNVLGAWRWWRIGPLELQPSEIAKFALVLYAGHWFANQRAELRHSPRGLLPFAAVVGVIVGLIVWQPDLGTTIVIVASLGALYFVAGARALHLAILAVIAIVVFQFYVHHLHGYQLARWRAYQNPNADPRGIGFQINQIRLALGSGGLFGVGLGNSQARQTLPEANSDSIFAIIGEELGLVGALSVMALFLLFAWRGMRASMLAPDLFGRLLAAGLTCSIVFQALVNMAVVSGRIPFTGVPLPFISYGSSSLTVSMVAAGILLSISKKAVNIREDRDPATSYFWWRNRRPHLPIASRRAPSGARAAFSRQPSAVSRQSSSSGRQRVARDRKQSAIGDQRSADDEQPPIAGKRAATGRWTAAGGRRPAGR